MKLRGSLGRRLDLEHVLLKMGALWQSMPPKMTTLRYREGGEGGGGGAECNHHDDVYHMYDVMVKSHPEGLHCQVPMCRKNFQTTAFGKRYIYN